MTEATIFKVHYGPLKVALNKKTFESQFPACEYEKHISEDYSPPGFFIICGVIYPFILHWKNGILITTDNSMNLVVTEETDRVRLQSLMERRFVMQ